MIQIFYFFLIVCCSKNTNLDVNNRSNNTRQEYEIFNKLVLEGNIPNSMDLSKLSTPRDALDRIIEKNIDFLKEFCENLLLNDEVKLRFLIESFIRDSQNKGALNAEMISFMLGTLEGKNIELLGESNFWERVLFLSDGSVDISDLISKCGKETVLSYYLKEKVAEDELETAKEKVKKIFVEFFKQEDEKEDALKLLVSHFKDINNKEFFDAIFELFGGDYSDSNSIITKIIFAKSLPCPDFISYLITDKKFELLLGQDPISIFCLRNNKFNYYAPENASEELKDIFFKDISNIGHSELINIISALNDDNMTLLMKNFAEKIFDWGKKVNDSETEVRLSLKNFQRNNPNIWKIYANHILDKCCCERYQNIEYILCIPDHDEFNRIGQERNWRDDHATRNILHVAIDKAERDDNWDLVNKIVDIEVSNFTKRHERLEKYKRETKSKRTYINDKVYFISIFNTSQPYAETPFVRLLKVNRPIADRVMSSDNSGLFLRMNNVEQSGGRGAIAFFAENKEWGLLEKSIRIHMDEIIMSSKTSLKGIETARLEISRPIQKKIARFLETTMVGLEYRGQNHKKSSERRVSFYKLLPYLKYCFSIERDIATKNLLERIINNLISNGLELKIEDYKEKQQYKEEEKDYWQILYFFDNGKRHDDN